MKHISAITIYNNEGMHYDTQRRYMITLRPMPRQLNTGT